MAKRVDVFGVEVEVGDIVLSTPKHKYAAGSEVGRVSGVFDSGRVTIQIPDKVTIYAYQRGAPDVQKESHRWVPDNDAEPDRWGRRPYKQEPYTYMSKDYTVVDHEWKWVRKQAADYNLIVLKKGDEDMKDLRESVGFNNLLRNLNLNYDAERPELD